MCEGRISSIISEEGTLKVYDGWDHSGGDGFIRGVSEVIDLNPTFGSWTHIAIASDGSAPGSLETMNVYINGELSHSTTSAGSTEERLGLYVCHWPYYGEYYYYDGFIDEMRVWSEHRTAEQIQSLMNFSLDLTDLADTDVTGNLMAYWNFDDEFDKPAVDQSFARDHSGNDNHLVYGGCAPFTKDYCPLDEFGLCKETINKEDGYDHVPGTPCYYEDDDEMKQLAEPMPTVRVSNAPIGGYSPHLLLSDPAEPLEFHLQGFSGDKSSLMVRFTDLPDNVHISVNGDDGEVTVANASGDGDYPISSTFSLTAHVANGVQGAGFPVYSSFKYRVRDGVLESENEVTVQFGVLCPAGTFLDASKKQCIDCPAGTFQETINSDAACVLCPYNEHAPELGSTSCTACEPFYYTKEMGSAECLLCEANDNQQVVIDDSGVKHETECPLQYNISPAMTTVGMVMTGIVGLVTLFALVLVMIFKKDRVIHNSSPVFLIIILLGCFFRLVGAALKLMDVTSTACALAPWFTDYGLMMSFGALFAKVRLFMGVEFALADIRRR